LTIRLAYLSLIKKLEARESKKTVTIDVPSINVTPTSNATVQKSIAVINTFNPSADAKSRDRAMTLDSLTLEVSFLKMLRYFLTRHFH
jgi:hypothetical protein